ncbi:MAG: ParA family protein [Anaerolineae bacterium]|jgi:chromosome partitioning protein
MRKIAIALSKGGVGKTTTAVNLAAGLARAGRNVLLVDMDSQGQAAKALGLRPQAGLAEIVMDNLSPDQVATPARDHVWLLAGGRSLSGLKRVIARKDFGGEQTLAEALVPLERRYDIVLIDTAPAWDTLTVNALFYASEILIPVSLEVMALQGMIDFIQSLAGIQKYHTGLTLRYILPTFMDRRVKKSEEILGQLQGYYDDLVCKPIRYNVRLSEAPGHGQTIFEYAPRSTGAADYQQLTERILQDGRSQTNA